MERLAKLSVALVLASAFVLPASASDLAKEKEEARNCAAIPNLLIAIESDNAGLQESAAFMLGELKCTKAVIPLMRILHEGKEESARIVAALALSRIGDARGVYAVRRAVEFDSSPRVQKTCAWFYNEYVRPQSFAFVPVEGQLPRQVAAH